MPPNAHDSDDEPVARIASGELEAASFLEVIKTGKPVIISEVTQSWPASTEWTDEYLREKAGDIVIDVEAGNDKYFHAAWQEKARTMTLSTYLRKRKTTNLY